MENQATSSGTTGPSFLDHTIDPGFIVSYDLLEEIWFIGMSLNQLISNCSTMPPLSGSRSCGTKFAGKGFVLRSYIKISDTGVFGIPRSASGSRTVSLWSVLTAARTRSTVSSVLLAAGLPECGSLSTDSQPSLKLLCHTFIVLHSLHPPWKPSESSEWFLQRKVQS